MRKHFNLTPYLVPLQELEEKHLNRCIAFYGAPRGFQQADTTGDAESFPGREILEAISAKGTLSPRLQKLALMGETNQKRCLGTLLQWCGSDLLNESSINRKNILDAAHRYWNQRRGLTGARRQISKRQVCEAMRDCGI